MTQISQTSETFRIYFLLRFTKELIKHSKLEEFFELNTAISKKEPKKEIEDEEDKNVFKDFELSIMNKRPPPREFIAPIMQPLPPPPQLPKSRWVLPIQNQQVASTQSIPQSKKGPILIPNFPLPSTVQYIRPIPMQIQIDLGKLNPIIRDPGVTSIECNGSDTSITTKGSAGTRITNITLTKEEINQVIETFANESRIPLHEGIFKAAVGQLLISAIFSTIVDSQFILRKIPPQNAMTQMYRY